MPSIEDVDRELCGRGLKYFAKLAWPLVENREYVPAWHVDLLCEWLEEVVEGRVKNLLILAPPRTGKSDLVNVMFPAWVWTLDPSIRFLTASYAASLSIRDAVRSRRLIESMWYQKRWGSRFRLTSDQNVKAHFENDHTGYRVTTSVGGTVTGEGGDVIILDDPHNLLDILSDTIRTETIRWWDEVASSRINNPKKSARIVVMQRAHNEDLAGHLKEKGGWTVVELPMEWEGGSALLKFPRSGRCVRRDPGDLLWPEMWGRSAVDRLKLDLGTWATACQLQQCPVPRFGNMLQADRVHIVDEVPTDLIYYRSWDVASTQKERFKDDPDYSCGTLAAVKDNRQIFIKDVRRGQWNAAKRNKVITDTALEDGPDVQVRVEVVGGYEDAYQEVKRILSGLSCVRRYRPSRDKVVRASVMEPIFEAGEVYALRGAWNEVWTRELLSFPNGKHDDQVDSLSAAVGPEIDRKGMMTVST